MMTNEGKGKGCKIGCLLLIAVLLISCLFLYWPLFFALILALLGFVFLTVYYYYKTKKEYKRSAYYRDYKKKFNPRVIADPVYRFYNRAVARNLPVRVPESLDDRVDGLSYFFYGDTMYLFPNFRQMRLSEDGRAVWQINYEEVWVDFGGVHDTIRERTMRQSQTIRFLVERRMIREYDLTKTPPPPCVFVTRTYETAFENEDDPLKLIAPRTAEQLCAMMRATPDLCGEFELTEDGEGIRWRVREDIQITLALQHPDFFVIGVDRLRDGKIECEITRRHPTVFEIYYEVCKIGCRGNVLVLCTRAGRGAVLYSGRKEDCPYKPNKKVLLGKYYYIEAE